MKATALGGPSRLLDPIMDGAVQTTATGVRQASAHSRCSTCFIFTLPLSSEPPGEREREEARKSSPEGSAGSSGASAAWRAAAVCQVPPGSDSSPSYPDNRATQPRRRR